MGECTDYQKRFSEHGFDDLYIALSSIGSVLESKQEILEDFTNLIRDNARDKIECFLKQKIPHYEYSVHGIESSGRNLLFYMRDNRWNTISNLALDCLGWYRKEDE